MGERIVREFDIGMYTLLYSKWITRTSLVAKTLLSQCRGPGSSPGQGTRPHMLQ